MLAISLPFLDPLLPITPTLSFHQTSPNPVIAESQGTDLHQETVGKNGNSAKLPSTDATSSTFSSLSTLESPDTSSTKASSPPIVLNSTNLSENHTSLGKDTMDNPSDEADHGDEDGPRSQRESSVESIPDFDFNAPVIDTNAETVRYFEQYAREPETLKVAQQIKQLGIFMNQKRRTGAQTTSLGMSTSYIDKDESGDYNPRGPKRTRQPPTPSRIPKRPRIQNGESRVQNNTRQVGYGHIVVLTFDSEKWRDKLKSFPAGPYSDRSESSSEEVSVADAGSMTVVRPRKPRKAKKPARLGVSNTRSDGLTLDMLTEGHPQQRGCKHCFEIGDDDCSLIEDPDLWPCEACDDCDHDCFLIIAPEYKQICEGCKKRRAVCSFKFDGGKGVEKCTACEENDELCVAGPLDEDRARKFEQVALAARSTQQGASSRGSSHLSAAVSGSLSTGDRKFVSCQQCRKSKQKCTLKGMDDAGICRGCKKAGTTCEFVDFLGRLFVRGQATTSSSMPMRQSMSSTDSVSSQSTSKAMDRERMYLACEQCLKAKTKCSLTGKGATGPCAGCKKKNTKCKFVDYLGRPWFPPPQATSSDTSVVQSFSSHGSVSSVLTSGPQEQGKGSVRERMYVACNRCRNEQLRCNLHGKKDKGPCRECKKVGLECTFVLPPSRAPFSQFFTMGNQPSISNELALFHPAPGPVRDLAGRSHSPKTLTATLYTEIEKRYNRKALKSYPLGMTDGQRHIRIETVFSHPIKFNYLPDPANIYPCSWCENPLFGFVGHDSGTGPRLVEGYYMASGKGFHEVKGGYKQDGYPQTKMCVQCTFKRSTIFNCEKHEMVEAESSTQPKYLDAWTKAYETRNEDDVEAENSLLDAKWCALCSNFAKYKCSCPQPDFGFGAEQGCGLELCDECEDLRRKVMKAGKTGKEILDSMIRIVKGDKLLWPSGARADAEFLTSTGEFAKRFDVNFGVDPDANMEYDLYNGDYERTGKVLAREEWERGKFNRELQEIKEIVAREGWMRYDSGKEVKIAFKDEAEREREERKKISKEKREKRREERREQQRQADIEEEIERQRQNGAFPPDRDGQAMTYVSTNRPLVREESAWSWVWK